MAVADLTLTAMPYSGRVSNMDIPSAGLLLA
jgi:hypothetical protein